MSERLPPDPNLAASVSTRTRGKKGKEKASTSSEVPIDPFQSSSSLRRSVLTPLPNLDDSDIASPESVDLVEPNQPHQPDSGFQDDTTPTPSAHTGTTEEIPRKTPNPHIDMAEGSGSNDQSYQGTGFTRQQWESLTGLIRNNVSNEGNNRQPPGNGNGDNSQDNTPGPNERPMSLMWKPDDIGYFDPEFDGQGPDAGLIGSSSRHVYYRDVYTFVDRLRVLAPIKGLDALRVTIPACLRGSALLWHTVELTEMERELLGNAGLEQWYTILIKRFKERAPSALRNIQENKYTMADAYKGKSPRVFAQELFRHAKAAEMTSVYNQLVVAWNNLDLEFRVHVPEPQPTTTMSQFLELLDSKTSLWSEMARKHHRASATASNPPYQSGRGAPSNRFPNRPPRGGYYNLDRPPQFQGRGYPPRPYNPQYQYQQANQPNPQYQQEPRWQPNPPNQAYDQRQLPYRKPLAIAAPPNSQPNAYSGRNNNRGSYDKGQYDKPRPRAYVAEEQEENEANNEGTEDPVKTEDHGSGYHIADPNVDFYDVEAYNQEGNEEPEVNFVATAMVPCRDCHQSFESRNALFRHLRSGTAKIARCPMGKATAKSPTAMLAKPSGELPKITPTNPVAAAKDIGTGYGFRNWHYVTAKARLSDEATPEPICLDTGCSVTLLDRTFFKSQHTKVEIRTMATPIPVRGIGSDKHMTSEYVIVPIHLAGTVGPNQQEVEAIITREAHLVDGLKAKMLVGMDIMGPEQIDIITSKKQAIIGTCQNAVIPIEVRPRSSPTKRTIHAKSNIVIPPHTEQPIPVHHIRHLPERDFLFEPGDSPNLALYAHMVDSSLSAIMARNESDQPISIRHNQRLGHLTELDYEGCYHVAADEPTRDLAIRRSAATHRAVWLRRLCRAAMTATVPEPPYESEGSALILEPEFKPMETVLSTGVTVYGDTTTMEALSKVVDRFPAVWKDSGKFVDLPMDNWMRIPLKPNWNDKVSGKARIYPLGLRDREVVDKTFDELQKQDRIAWTARETPFSYPVFVVWKTLENGTRKGRVVVDIRGLNAVTIPDAYPLPLQADITAAVKDASFISVVDCASFFYQWRVHPDDRHKLTVVSHRGQESFNVAVMGFKNSPAYVQRQIDRLLRPFRTFARAYVDDIVIYSKTLKEHLRHLSAIFSLFVKRGISIKPSKAFLGYPTVQLLGQKVSSLGLATDEEKLKAIACLTFPRTLKELETYLGLTGWLRQFVPHYAAVTKPLQERKTTLLKPAPKAGNPRKSYASRTSLMEPNPAEIASFETLQSLLSKPSYLVHFDSAKRLYIDLDASKSFGFGAMIYHTKEEVHTNIKEGDPPIAKTFPSKSSIQPIMFLSRLLKPAETRYWPTELELAGMVWVVRKVRHLIESSNLPTIIHTDHGANVGIVKQTSLSTTSTEKQNLRLVRASEYLQRFNLDVRHKPGKQHIVPDALSRLASTMPPETGMEEGELDALFAVDALFVETYAEMSDEFRKRLIQGYDEDPAWRHTIDVLDKDKNNGGEDTANLPFEWGSDGVIWHRSLSTSDHAFEPRRLVIPRSLHKDVFHMIHTQDGHPGFQRCLDRLQSAFYIRRAAKHLKDYLLHCPECLVFQTRRHKPYGSLQPIQSPPIPFHTLAIDFILALPSSEPEGFDCLLSVTDKFSKRITLIPGQSTYTAEQWAHSLLTHLYLTDWGLPKAIVSDRDPKFLSELWKALFRKLGVSLFYTTAYHPQADGQSERTNQTVEIALRFYLNTMAKATEWPKSLPFIQSNLNNAKSNSTGKTPNETVYGFSPNVASTLNIAAGSVLPLPASRIEVADAVDFAKMDVKYHYDRKHQPLAMRVGDYALLRLHRGYSIPAITNKKLGQQYVGPFRIIDRIGQLAYKLDIPPHWRVHPVFTVAQLEPCPSPKNDPFNRPRPEEPPTVFVEGDTESWKSFELKRLLNRRITRQGRGQPTTQYLARWKGYGPEYDTWLSLKNLGNATDLVEEYDKAFPPHTSMAKATGIPAKGKASRRKAMG